MTSAQAVSLVAALKAAHPTRRVPADTINLWEQRLQPLEHNKASVAMSDLIDHQKFWPSIAEFLDHYRQHVERERREQRRDDAYEPLDPNSEEGRRVVEQMRAYVAAMGRSL